MRPLRRFVRPARALVIGALTLVSLTGCYAAGRKVTLDQLEAFEPGHTTYADVVAALGEPTSESVNSDRTRQVFYVYTQQQAKVENFIPIVAMFAQGATSEQTTVQLDFDARKVLVSYAATKGNMRIGTGLSSGGKQ